MIVNNDLFTISIVPKTKHYIFKLSDNNIFVNNDSSRHTHMMQRMASIVKRRKSNCSRITFLCCVTTNSLTDTGYKKCIHCRNSMISMHFSTSNRDQNHIIFLLFFFQIFTDRSLDIHSRCSKLRVTRKTKFSKHLIKLFFCCIENLFFHPTNFSVFETHLPVIAVD